MISPCFEIFFFYFNQFYEYLVFFMETFFLREWKPLNEEPSILGRRDRYSATG